MEHLCGELRWQNGWDSTGLRLDLTAELQQRRTRKLTLDQDWLVATGWSLATILTAGRIAGTVFLDANRNGRQEASEGGAAGVTVYPDNRYPVRTDAQGHDEFPFVAAGARVIGVLRETLPLPWVPVRDGAATVDVLVRDNLRVDIGVVRQGRD